MATVPITLDAFFELLEKLKNDPDIEKHLVKNRICARAITSSDFANPMELPLGLKSKRTELEILEQAGGLLLTNNHAITELMNRGYSIYAVPIGGRAVGMVDVNKFCFEIR